MGEALLEALLDSLKILAVLFGCNVIIALIEPKISKSAKLKGNFAPLIGVSIGLLPQCGFSVVATDLYQKRHITLGTLVGVYLATSDEALPIFLSYPDKALHVLPLLAFKFVLGLIFGYLIDVIFTKHKKEVEEHLETCDEEYKIRLTHCDAEEPTGEDKRAKIKHNLERFLLSPLIHSLKIFVYILVVNLLFAVLIFYVGEDSLISFLSANRYVAPLLAVVVGAVPNCVASVVISELYVMGGLGFGAALGGLCMNAGVGYMILFKNPKQWKNNLAVIGIMFAISIVVSYGFSAAFGFSALNF